MDSNARSASSGWFELGLPAAEAIGLFTPEGERPWAPGWDPIYSDGEPSEASGTVFTTAAHGVETIWVIIEIDRPAATAAYARVTPGHHAGTVRVRCEEASPGRTVVSVSYRMSPLRGAEPGDLEAFGPAQFEAMMKAWESAIGAHLGSS